MPTITPELAGGLNVCAFMDTIAFAEGTSTSPITQDDGYDIIVSGVNGMNRFTDYSDHPFAGGRASIVVNSRGLTSNAAGRYQQMLKDWPHYKAMLKLPDFGRVSQDLLCLQHIKEAGALKLLQAGRFAEACDRVSNIWASIPGSRNTYGQPQRQLESLRATYILSGGTVS